VPQLDKEWGSSLMEDKQKCLTKTNDHSQRDTPLREENKPNELINYLEIEACSEVGVNSQDAIQNFVVTICPRQVKIIWMKDRF
jgi:hypothetical protein